VDIEYTSNNSIGMPEIIKFHGDLTKF